MELLVKIWKVISLYNWRKREESLDLIRVIYKHDFLIQQKKVEIKEHEAKLEVLCDHYEKMTHRRPELVCKDGMKEL